MTNIPVPALYYAFEDAGAYYVISEYVYGVSMSSLSDSEKKTVTKEIEIHLATLRSLKSKSLGGPPGIVIPPSSIPCDADDRK